MVIVETVHLSKAYVQGTGEVFALRDLTLSLERGGFYAIAGPSGSGKTTLLNIIGCLDTPTSGSAFIEGKEISHLTLSERSRLRRDRIGFVLQSFNLIPVLTAPWGRMERKASRPKFGDMSRLCRIGMSKESQAR